MGDISAEPSMEEILSSIKRIIAEEGDAAVATRTRRSRAVPATARAARDELDDQGSDEVLELSEPVADEFPGERPRAMGAPTPPEPARAENLRAEPSHDPVAKAEPILSERATEATRGPLEALSRLIVRPEVAGSDTLEGMVRDMLKPMLREWLDSNLPQLVETMVAREISRITGRQ
ncbi:DUF2497 domain-containing protein [Sphingomonas sp. M1-B02]|uniref:DUF2497 domain-containing protein n=1 Tax=Sphingomonas sp. M1-B02 TaxID=3114300 RepID=UPI00223FD664|nr:DUF2497 domain-containing protein [Sphingomonas sp. S6-11]UZK66855.1 DUF2497 domain-containing protein [Sphingomonas sp. S6-11]